MPAPLPAPLRLEPTATVWDYLALPDDELERADLVAMNVTVARGIPALRDLSVERYVQVVDKWTEQFRNYLPGAEKQFKQSPWKWRNDRRFFRVGMLQGFLGHMIGLNYLEYRKNAKGTPKNYTDPGELFLNGLIDTKQGTCGNMPVLHAAISRRMGWPVSLACVFVHQFSRFDDGEVVYNIESTSNQPGTFSAPTDEEYLKWCEMPKLAVECGSDLRRLTAREMIAIFVGFRGRHFADIDRDDLADVEFSLARHLFPNHRISFVSQINPFLNRGKRIFLEDEPGHAEYIAKELSGRLQARVCDDVFGRYKFVPVSKRQAPRLPPVKKATISVKNVFFDDKRKGFKYVV